MPKLRRRLASGTLAVLLVLVAGSPYIAAVSPFRDIILRAVLPKIRGTVSSGGASLGWFSPIEFRDIEIRSPDGAPVVIVPRLRGDRPVWRYLIEDRSLGNMRMDRPLLNVVMLQKGSNVGEVLAADADESQRPRLPPDLSLTLEITDASLVFRSRHAQEPWTIEGFNLNLEVRPETKTESGQAELIVRKGTVFDRAPITPAMCDDLLKYIAPVLAEATDVSGEFSIDVDDWQWPLGNFSEGEGSGRLTIHAVDVGAAPLVRALNRRLNLPPSVRVADNSIVEFTMADRRVHHRDLQFGVGRLQVRTRGSVGLDQTLDLVAEIPIPARLLRDVPLSETLKTHTLKLPVRGTLAGPKIDAAELGTANVDLLLDTLNELLRKRKGRGDGPLERLLDSVPSADRPVLDRIRRRPLFERIREGPPRDGLRQRRPRRREQG